MLSRASSHGGMRWRDAVPAQATSSAAPRVVALVVGNGDYVDSAMDLAGPTRDATGVADALRTRGADVTLLTDATHEQLIGAVDAFVAALGPNDQAVFYYAGHSFVVEEENGALGVRLVPVDFVRLPTETAREGAGSVRRRIRMRKFGTVLPGIRLDAAPGTLSLNGLIASLVARGSGLNFVMLDGSTSGPQAEPASLPLGGLTASMAGATVVWFAAAPGTAVLDTVNGSPGMGALAVALTEGLHSREGAPDLTLLFRHVAARVVDLTNGQQRPVRWDSTVLPPVLHLAPGEFAE